MIRQTKRKRKPKKQLRAKRSTKRSIKQRTTRGTKQATQPQLTPAASASRVLEVVERDGRRTARVLTPGSIVEVPVDHIPHLHLDDLVQVSSGKKGKAKVALQVSEADLPNQRRSTAARQKTAHWEPPKQPGRH